MPTRIRGLATIVVVAALALVAGASRITANSTRDRTISFYSVNTKETLTIQYMKDGKRIPEAMQKINWILRDWRRDEPTEMDPDLIDLVWEVHTELRLRRADPHHLRLPFALHQRHAAPYRRRPGEREPPHPRQGDGRAFPRRAGEKAALLGPHPRARRRRLLPDLGDTVRASRYRPRAHLAAPAACGAGLALPQRPHPAPAERRRVDHARRRAPGTRRRYGACGADRRVPPVAHAAETGGPGRLADALPAAAHVDATARAAAVARGHTADRWRARQARRTRGRAAAEPSSSGRCR